MKRMNRHRLGESKEKYLCEEVMNQNIMLITSKLQEKKDKAKINR
tara:strand:+ start:338 stop:472 length:135 start_codon:yes stop_codon:yes gene_type:complete